MRCFCAFIARSVAVVIFCRGALIRGPYTRSPVAERIRRVARRRWRWGWPVVAAGRWWGFVVVGVFGQTRPPLRPALAFDDAAERRDALRIELDVERREVERGGLDDLDLAAAVAVTRHDVDVARRATTVAAWVVSAATRIAPVRIAVAGIPLLVWLVLVVLLLLLLTVAAATTPTTATPSPAALAVAGVGFGRAGTRLARDLAFGTRIARG